MGQILQPPMIISSMQALSEPILNEPNPLDIIIQTMAVWVPRGRDRKLGDVEYTVELPSDNEDEGEIEQGKECTDEDIGIELAMVLGDGLSI